jgi:hypothetical protein
MTREISSAVEPIYTKKIQRDRAVIAAAAINSQRPTLGIRPARLALASVLVAGFFCGAATVAKAACQQWSVPSPSFAAHQQKKYAASPIEFIVYFHLNPGGTQLKGDAEYYHATAGRGGGALGGKGPAAGFIRGNSFEVTASWSPTSIGVYSGTINGDGHITGTTYNRANPGSKMDWYSPGPLNCAVELNSDRPGGDYRNFDLASGNYEECRTACASDHSCRAYSFVKPGVPGVSGRCWLKKERPYSRANTCCVSGVIR